MKLPGLILYTIQLLEKQDGLKKDPDIFFILEELINNDSMDKNKQICLPDTISATKDRNLPTLKESTIFALDYLDNEEEGFFMMVEGACIDKRAHSNLADEEMIELMAFEETVYETYLWAKGRDDTLIIVTADHETGGLYFDGTPTKSTILQKMK